MEREKKVIDASVMVKWFVKEEGSEKAVLMRDQHIEEKIEIVVPELALIEVLNALRFKNNSEEELKKMNKSLHELQLKIEKTTESVLDKAIQNAKKYDLTIYDALYLAVANFYGSPLISADEKLTSSENVVLLKNL